MEVVLRYHARSKHDFGRYAASLGFLDWDNQPDPFRRFEGAPRLELSLHDATCDTDTGERSANPSEPSFDALLTPGTVAPRALDAAALSRFLFHALALSAAKRIETSSWFLRVNPSSGNLHPTEGWLILPALPSDGSAQAGASARDTPTARASAGASAAALTAPALSHYAPDAHALEQRALLQPEFADALFASLPEGAFLVALSSIAWREAWKYGERAYRYVNHDVGHALGALRYGAALCGWSLRRVPGVSSARLAELLGLDLNDESPEAETPDLLAIVFPAHVESDAVAALTTWTPPPDSALAPLQGTPNALSSEHHPWPVIAAMEEVCRDDGSPRTPAQPAEGDPELPGQLTSPPAAAGHDDAVDLAASPAALVTTPPRDALATRIIRARRSAVSMDRTSRLSAADFFRMLAATHPSLAPAPFDALAAPPRVHLFLFVHRVDDVAPGLYFLPRHDRALDEFRAASDAPFTYDTPPGCPPELPLVKLHEHDARSAAARVSCGQDIAADGCFSLGMLAELDPALRTEGPSVYPRLYWETGLIGQVLYLQAHAAGVSATGIGCFFDDPVHALAGLRDARFQSLYHFTVGGAVHDPRLMDEPPYAERDAH
ncbi:MAG: hypothetical protein DHS20C15_13740 [Planctomycetota bacterium]|nr:MAG: hypothetical protein DHS20C15_13740 [Planctomycetota bacterium]